MYVILSFLLYNYEIQYHRHAIIKLILNLLKTKRVRKAECTGQAFCCKTHMIQLRLGRVVKIYPGSQATQICLAIRYSHCVQYAQYSFLK